VVAQLTPSVSGAVTAGQPAIRTRSAERGQLGRTMEHEPSVGMKLRRTQPGCGNGKDAALIALIRRDLEFRASWSADDSIAPNPLVPAQAIAQGAA
jgi:hypothetical protein